MEQNQEYVYEKIHTKYKVLQVRAKISFMAFEKQITIQQLFLKAILKTYHNLVTEGFLKPALSYMKKDTLYSEIIRGEKSIVDAIVQQRL